MVYTAKLWSRLVAFFLLLSFCICAREYKKVSIHYIDQARSVHELVMTQQEQRLLRRFMEKLFAEDNFAYTLLGSKPVSWAFYQNPSSRCIWHLYANREKRNQRILQLGWKVWEKYHRFFPSTLFFLESSADHSDCTSILLINLKCFNEVIDKHKEDFEKILERPIENGSQLLRERVNHPLISDTLKGHRALIGIILGYGRDNAWQFFKASEEHRPLDWVWDEEEYWSQQENLQQYTSSTQYHLSLYSCPSFAGIKDSAESLALKRHYLNTKKRILRYYQDQDFLEATLSLLAGFRPE